MNNNLLIFVTVAMGIITLALLIWMITKIIKMFREKVRYDAEHPDLSARAKKIKMMIIFILWLALIFAWIRIAGAWMSQI